jgi:hypothetical protein
LSIGNREIEKEKKKRKKGGGACKCANVTPGSLLLEKSLDASKFWSGKNKDGGS